MNNKSNKTKPLRKGLYVCRVAGSDVQRVLHYHYCEHNGRSWWTDTAGYDVTQDVVVVKPFKMQDKDVVAGNSC